MNQESGKKPGATATRTERRIYRKRERVRKTQLATEVAYKVLT